MKKIFLRILALCLMLTLLSGCSTVPPVTDPTTQTTVPTTMTEPPAQVWELGDNWEANEDGTSLSLSKKSGGTAVWKAAIDMSASKQISMEWIANSSASGSAVRTLDINLVNSNGADHLNLRFHRSQNSGGNYTIRITASYYPAQGAEPEQILDGSCISDDEKTVKIQLQQDANLDGLQINLSNNVLDRDLYVGFVSLAGFTDQQNRAQCVANIFNGTALSLQLAVPEENSASYELEKIAVNNLTKTYRTDYRMTPFAKVVFAGDFVDSWTENLVCDLEEYQIRAVETATVAAELDAIQNEKGDLVIIANGLTDLLGGKPAEDYAAELKTLIKGLKEKLAEDAVVLVTGVPYLSDEEMGTASVETCAQYNAEIRAVASATGVEYANLTRLLSAGAWTKAEGFSPVGNQLAAGEILVQLMRSCPCLAVRTYTDLDLIIPGVASQSLNALNAFKVAATAEDVKKTLEADALGADLSLYRTFGSDGQAKMVADLLAADRSCLEDFADADALINATAMKLVKQAARTQYDVEALQTYVAVGDSITEGSCAMTIPDNWVYTFGDLWNAVHDDTLKVVDGGIGGTMMATPAGGALGTVGNYIISEVPDMITVAYGINDYHASTSLTTFVDAYDQYLAKVTEQMDYLVDLLEKPEDTVIVLCGLCAKGNDSDSTAIKQWNNEIRALAEKYGLYYVDTYYDMRGVDWLLADGLHPNNAGYRALAHIIYRSVCTSIDFVD